ncbi:MAG: ATP-binding protein [Lachnospiraceae bacterium]|nr:ATP-binding protein [Lachnospiraceae bacterium]
MGIYLNPDNVNFEEDTRARIYVDKTMMIREINHFMDEGNKYICVSRPRRFGKTMAGNMLAAYYSKGCDSYELFSKFKIAKDPSFEEKLNKYNVIQIDVNGVYQITETKDWFLKELTKAVKKEIQKEFSEIEFEEDDSLAECILKVYTETGETFIFIMDEYDILARERVDQSLLDEYLSFLNGLFKSNVVRPAISLAYLTGILPVVRDKIQSKLNNFREYTIFDARELAEYIGFTGDEVKELCLEKGIDFEECRRWYDGYRQQGFEIYNPKSLVEALETRQFSSYWNMTSTYEAVAERIRQNFAGTKDAVIRMISGEEVEVNAATYLNTMDSFVVKDDLFTYLIHLGYLAYNMERKTCRIPNKEIQQEWFAVAATNPDYAVTDGIIKSSRELLEETIKGNEDAVAKALDVSHIHVTSNRSYNNEDALQSAIYLAYIYALNEYDCFKELTTGKGFVDVVYVPVHQDKPALIIELKHNKRAESAIGQIKEKKYFDSLSRYSGDMLFVGINYDEDEKTHECRIERFEKE